VANAFLAALQRGVLVVDGSMGATIQNMTLDVERDYLGRENCVDVLVRSRPEVIYDIHDAFLEEIRVFLDDDQISDDAEARLRHGHGQTQEEMYNIKYGRLERIPDLIAYPAGDEDVAGLVRAARHCDVSLIPFGGGTNVSDALRCPVQEKRMIVSVDMSRMNRILWIDPENRMACIQAGAVGRHLTEQLRGHGFTMGHEPDSIEFSTLGGWIATHASGMKKNRYGNIEDLVLDVTVVTARGTLERSAVAPRESVGVGDARRWIFGSEGGFGIVTQAVVKIFPLPEAQVYGSIVFPDLEHGVAFLYELTQTATPPASITQGGPSPSRAGQPFPSGPIKRSGSPGSDSASARVPRPITFSRNSSSAPFCR